MFFPCSGSFGIGGGATHTILPLLKMVYNMGQSFLEAVIQNIIADIAKMYTILTEHPAVVHPHVPPE